MRRLTRGLTMVEILVATVILLMGFLAVSGLFSRNLKLVERSGEMTEASEIARRMFEVMQTHPSSIPDPPATFSPGTPVLTGAHPFPPAPFPTIDGDKSTYQISVKVEDAGVTGMKAVEINVAWEKGEGLRLQKLFR